MANLTIKSKNEAGIDKKPRVYFTCHPEDFEKYFKQICDDIFKTHDCAIYYTEDMTEAIPEDEKEVDLGRNNLFVVPVTFKLLSTPSRAMDEDIPYAGKHHIPILPIMMEPGIDAVYARPDKFGELQYLNPYSSDLTEISYEEKLKRHLESVLISDEMAQRVRAAFDAYIFLSYRKKDRKYANELMRLIHSNPECRDIAIWFDEFLTPGESFREGIEKMLDSCQLFTLLVTPQLLEKVTDEKGVERDNYVVSTELPMARRKREEKGTDILAVEMEKTDRDALSTLHVENCVNVNDEAFRTRLMEVICKIATTENDTPEHNFLIGLAYLEGIDVEVDRDRGIELITSAAEAGIPSAMSLLRNMYRNGIGVNIDYRHENYWANRIAEYCTENYGTGDFKTLVALNDLATSYRDLGNYQTALELSEKGYELCRTTLGEKDPNTLGALNNLALVYAKLGDHGKAAEMHEKTYHLMCQIQGENHPNTLKILNNLANACCEDGDPRKALKILEKSYPLTCKILGQDHPDTLTTLYNLASAHNDLGDHKKALAIYEDVYQLQCKILSEEHPSTLRTLNNIAFIHSKFNNHQKALEMNERVYHLTCQIQGEEHPDTLTSLNNLASIHNKLGNHREARKLFERTYQLCCKVQGEDHLDTIETLNSLASTYDELGNHRRAVGLFEKVYHLRCKIQGEETLDTLDTIDRLVLNYTRLKEIQKVLEFLEKSYALRCKLHGKKHPVTVETLKNLTFIYNKLGDHEKHRRCTPRTP